MDSRFCSTNWIRKLKRLHNGGLYNQAIGIEPVRNLKSLNGSVVKRASARFQSCFCTRLTLFEFETIVSRSSEASNFQSLLQFAKKKIHFKTIAEHIVSATCRHNAATSQSGSIAAPTNCSP